VFVELRQFSLQGEDGLRALQMFTEEILVLARGLITLGTGRVALGLGGPNLRDERESFVSHQWVADLPGACRR